MISGQPTLNNTRERILSQGNNTNAISCVKVVYLWLLSEVQFMVMADNVC